MPSKILRTLPLVALAALLSGCKMVVLNPSGDIAVQQRDLIVISTVLMLLIIVPVIVLTLVFVLGNLLVDLAYAWLDPRIRLAATTP